MKASIDETGLTEQLCSCFSRKHGEQETCSFPGRPKKMLRGYKFHQFQTRTRSHWFRIPCASRVITVAVSHHFFYVMSVYFQPLYIITVDSSLQTILTQCIRSHTVNVLIQQKKIFTFSSALCFSYLALYRLRVGRFLNAHHSAPGPTHGRGICAVTWLLLNKAVLCLRSAASGR